MDRALSRQLDWARARLTENLKQLVEAEVKKEFDEVQKELVSVSKVDLGCWRCKSRAGTLEVRTRLIGAS